jgi:hypothetical protein
MQDKHLFEYAVIRVVPKIEREEFLNVGVILYCPAQKFLESVFVLEKSRLLAFSDHLDIDEIREYLLAFEQTGRGTGPIGKLTLADRFRWLTATRSTMVQTSKVHPGFCKDAQDTLSDLFRQLVQ